MSSGKHLFIFGICALVFGLLAALYVLTINHFSKSPERTDFYKFYKSAEFFFEGKSIYTPVPFVPPADYLDKISEKARATLKTFHPNLNSPSHTLFMLPFGVMPFRVAFWVWSILSLFLGLTGTGLVVTSRIFHDYQTPTHGDLNQQQKTHFHENQPLHDGWLDTHAVRLLIPWIILLAYYPTWVNFQFGQFGPFMLGLLILTWSASRKEEYRFAGIVLGIAISLKILFGLFLIFFAAQRRWRLLFWAIAIFALCNILSILAFGLSTYRQHLELIALSARYINASWNASFSGFFTRIFGGAENIPLLAMPFVAYGLAYGLSFFLTIEIIRVAWRLPQPQKVSPLRRFDVGFSLTIVAMLLISPFGWMYYFPVLIIPLLVGWHASSALHHSKLYKCLLAAAWILSSIPTTLINSEETAMDQPILWFTSAGYYFYSLVGFCVLLLFLSRRLDTDMRQLP